MAYVDQSGNAVVIGRQIGRRGGEGSVFEANSHPGSVVKIYHEPPDGAKAAKLAHLVRIATPTISKFSAWPQALVWDNQQKLRGFLMPMVQGKEIHELFQPKERFTKFPNTKWDFLVRVARNVAAAFDEVHRIGVVIGDVNEGNLLVKRDSTICLIDCDSYQTGNNGQTWTCDVGVAFWTPPELQGRNFRGLVRQANHDLFGLSAMIFKLLFMGRHPYAGKSTRPGETLLEQAIAEFRFAFSDQAATYGMEPPPHCLPLGVLARNHRDLFERAFTRGSERDGARPSARDWVVALEALEKGLKSCSSDPAHRLPSHLSQCPWCSIASGGGPNFFISVNVTMPHGPVGVQVWDAIIHVTALTPTGFSMARVAQVPLPAPNPTAPETIQRVEFKVGIALLAFAIFIVFAVPMLGLICGLVGAGLLYGGKSYDDYSRVRRERNDGYNRTEKELEQRIQEIEKLETQYRAAFNSTRDALQKVYDRLLHLDRERKAELQSLETRKRQIQLDAFLDTQLLKNARITGVGPAKLGTLLAYGVESALDITNRLAVPGIGPVFLSRLVDWRRNCESRFRFNPNQAVPAAEMHALNVKYANIRKTLEIELQAGPAKLTQINSRAAAQREPLHQKITGLIKSYTQLKSDLQAIPKD